MLANVNMSYLVSGMVPVRMGNAHETIVPYHAFATLDGHIIVGAGNDQQFRNLCTLAGRNDLSTDPRFAKNSGRVANRAILVPILESIFFERTNAHWLKALETAGIPCGPINNLSDVWKDPQVQHRNMRIELAHPITSSVASVASPLHFSERPVAYHSAPPLLGANNDEVKSEFLKWNENDIVGLKLEIKPGPQGS
jgi:crotonobetainyl-CoA:carnitine CoA-transferase CaiB-like acyl-CoA transferase